MEAVSCGGGGGAVLTRLCDVEAAGFGADALCISHEPSEEARTVLVCVVCAAELLSSGSVPSLTF